jgi:hypothetical protein
MASVAKRLFASSALPLGCALAALWAAPDSAQSDTSLFKPDSFELSGDLRLVAVDGEKGWIDGGFGKLRSGSDGELRLRPQLGNASLVWRPQFTWSLSAIVVASVQGGERTQAGLSQAYLTFKPMRASNGVAFSARAGLMWPPVSLEHEGADWHVRDSITPSAINSWIGEEVRPAAVEATLATDLGRNKLRATAAAFAANDTSGTLLTFRGWGLHDSTTLAFNRQPLPPLDGPIGDMQGPITHPLLDIHSGFAHRPGYYAKLAWQPPVPLRFELFRYDNRAEPEDVTPTHEWGWRTKFNQVAAVAQLPSAVEIKTQALSGTTDMGYHRGERRWVESRFRSAFLLVTRSFGPFGLAIRGEGFDTRNHGSVVGDEYDETGWSAMIAGKREWGPVTGLVEVLHVSSEREDREDVGLEPRQRQTSLQAQVRMRW